MQFHFLLFFIMESAIVFLALKTSVSVVAASESAGYAVPGAAIGKWIFLYQRSDWILIGNFDFSDSIDECGLRFLMAMKQHEYLLRCLPLKQRSHLKAAGKIF